MSGKGANYYKAMDTNGGPNSSTQILTRTSVSQKRKWVSLGVLLFINLINYMDRLTVSAVLEVTLKNKWGRDFSNVATMYNKPFPIYSP